MNRSLATHISLKCENSFADPQSNQLWLGHTSGRISVYQCSSTSHSKLNKSRLLNSSTLSRLSFNSAFQKISSKGKQIWFLGQWEVTIFFVYESGQRSTLCRINKTFLQANGRKWLCWSNIQTKWRKFVYRINSKLSSRLPRMEWRRYGTWTSKFGFFDGFSHTHTRFDLNNRQITIHPFHCSSIHLQGAHLFGRSESHTRRHRHHSHNRRKRSECKCRWRAECNERVFRGYGEYWRRFCQCSDWGEWEVADAFTHN